MKLLFIIDPIHRLDPCHDSSVAMMEAAQLLGHEVFITQANLLFVKNGQAWAILQQVELVPIDLVNGRWLTVDNWFKLGDSFLTTLDIVDAVFMRTDPPVNDAYLYATYILDYVDQNKTLVINAPEGIRSANEKMYALQFTECVPETIVSANKQVIKDFVEAKQATILKPLGNKAGEGILFLQAGDRNFNSIIELSTMQGQIPVMVQTYLPQAKEGDKRIILLDGKPIGALNRLASNSDFRNNMATGGTVAQTSITAREEEICCYLAPKLQQDGLIFVGIDVIGGYLTEVNVTSPTGIREIDRLDGTRLGQDVIKWAVRRVDN
ncbi:glutathione synthase [Anabaena sp. FACHB-1237]|uniref:glutathione synthase n=1 Tax=Anabaena sp. FACHB-1237 TaxID=2692769 RepID=UPI001680B747|nr:glutathione synthase [Anabaena sp. FACHB-1237]MBD2138005.1 glutathione synthase [Anabaena sp. FACHB-1237]